MAVKNELAVSSSQQRLWLPVLCLVVLLEAEGNAALSIRRLQSSTAHNCCFSASCPWVRRCRKPAAESTVEILAICSDLLPPSPNPLPDATVGSLTRDTALMKLSTSAAPAVVRGGIIYCTVNLITFHEC